MRVINIVTKWLLMDELGTEITGDYGNTSTIYNSIRGADLIITTVCILPTPVVANADCRQPEKFDSMTRRSRNLGNMSQRLQLIMIDEVRTSIECLVSKRRAGPYFARKPGCHLGSRHISSERT